MKNSLKSLKKSQLFTISISVSAALISTSVLLLIFADLMVKNDINFETVKYFWFAISAISGLISGLISGKLVKSKGIIWGSISSLIYVVTLLLIVAIVNNFNISALFFVLIPIAALFGALGGVISSNLR